MTTTPLQKALTKWREDYRDSGSLPTRIFHYTSPSTLCCILESNRFWMTNYRHVNDPSEFRYSLDVVNQCLDQHCGEIEVEVLRGLRKLLVVNPTPHDRTEFGPYIASFSEDPDSLYQWRAYGEDGWGVCIGIEPPSRGDRYKRNLWPVVYDKKGQTDQVERCLRQFMDICTSHSDRSPLSVKVSHLYLALMDLRTHFKHSAYFPEKEWRYTNFDGDHHARMRWDQRGVFPYFPDAPIVDDNNLLPIREIRLGPKQDKDRGVQAIRILLQQHGYDADRVHVSQSDIPY